VIDAVFLLCNPSLGRTSATRQSKPLSLGAWTSHAPASRKTTMPLPFAYLEEDGQGNRFADIASFQQMFSYLLWDVAPHFQPQASPHVYKSKARMWCDLVSTSLVDSCSNRASVSFDSSPEDLSYSCNLCRIAILSHQPD
jgi:hypothetical protein